MKVGLVALFIAYVSFSYDVWPPISERTLVGCYSPNDDFEFGTLELRSDRSYMLVETDGTVVHGTWTLEYSGGKRLAIRNGDGYWAPRVVRRRFQTCISIDPDLGQFLCKH